MNWIKRFRKLNIKAKVAVLCVICLVASLGLNVFDRTKITTKAADEYSNSYVYFDASNLTLEDGETITAVEINIDGWGTQLVMSEVSDTKYLWKSNANIGNYGFGPNYRLKITTNKQESIQGAEMGSSNDNNMKGKVYQIASLKAGAKTTYYNANEVKSYIDNEFGFVDLTRTISKINVVYYDKNGKESSPSDENLEDGKIHLTVPKKSDCLNDQYTAIEFKNGNETIVKANLSDLNSSKNIYYYGGISKNNSVTNSYWGAKRGTQAVNLSKIYFNNQSFPIVDSEKPVTVTYDGKTYQLSADSEDATTYSVELAGLTQNKVIEFTYGDTTYRFYADNATHNQVGIDSNGYAAINATYVDKSKMRTFYFDATLSKLAYTTIDDTSGDYIYFSMKDANSMAKDVGTPQFGYKETNGNVTKKTMECLNDGDFRNGENKEGFTYRINVKNLNQNSSFWFDKQNGNGLTASTDGSDTQSQLGSLTIAQARGMVFRITEPVYKTDSSGNYMYNNGQKIVDYYPLIAESLMATMPQRIDDGKARESSTNMKKMYVRLYQDGNIANGQSFEMTRYEDYTQDGHTWSDVYGVDIDPNTVAKYNRMFYFSGNNTSDYPNSTTYAYMASRTVELNIPVSNSKNCFYADSSDDVIYYKNGKATYNRDGYFDDVYKIRDSENGKNKTTVDIKANSFNKQKDTVYVHSTFYDYYSDYEIDGNNRDDYDNNKYTSIRGQKNWSTFRQLSQALSDYYAADGGTDIPIYTGHFQPYEFEGTLFRDIAPTLNLYGYANKNVNSVVYHNFMSVNNSKLSNNISDTSDDDTGEVGYYAFASLGLVGNTLGENDTLYTRNTNVGYGIGSEAASNSTSKALPHFDSDFLKGNNSKNTVLGNVYEDVAFPFKKKYLDTNGKLLEYNESNKNKTGITYYSFNSADTTVYMNKVSNTNDTKYQYYLNETSNSGQSNNVNSSSETSTVSTKNGFFPFNETSTTNTASRYNYGFGSKLEFSFSLTEDGMVQGTDKKYPITFEFSGDDDVWVFIDGKLVLDLGGSHGQVSGKINFADQTAMTKQTTVSAVKASPGYSLASNANNPIEQTYTFKMSGANTGKHKLTMFYMERGMWESNMSVRYNFIDNNDLEVTKTVDTSDVASEFATYFTNSANKMYSYNILNRVTHYGSKPVSTTSENIPPVVFANDFSESHLQASSDKNVFQYENKFAGADKVVKYLAYHNNDNRLYTDKRLGIITPDTGSNVDIGKMDYLKFNVYFNGNSPVTSRLYIKLEFTNGQTAYGYLDTSVINGDTGLKANQWSEVKVNLAALNGYNSLTEDTKKSLKSISVQYDNEATLYFDNFIFEHAADIDMSRVGFIVQQDQIPDYGSANSGNLEYAVGATYLVNSSDSTRTGALDSTGKFSLAANETALFSNQFRRGSYIQLNELLSESDQKLFTPTYTVSEYDNETGKYVDVDGDIINRSNERVTVTTNGGAGSLVNIGLTGETISVEDNRIEKVDPDNSIANAAKYTTEQDTVGKSFVFRSYLYPDSDELSLDLRLNFNNKVNVGKIELSKIQSDNSDADLADTQEYKFYIVYTNIGGRSLENAPIIEEVTLTKNQTWEKTGIPVGTEYRIYEVLPSDKSSLDYVNYDKKIGNSVQETNVKIEFAKLTEVTAVNDKELSIGTPYISGVISDQDYEGSYQFANQKKEFVELSIKKIWENTPIDKLPLKAEFRLVQYKGESDTTGTVLKVKYNSDKSAYVIETDDAQKGLITMNKPSENEMTWTTKVVGLDKTFKAADNTKQPYIYKLVEVLNDGADHIDEFKDSDIIRFDTSSADGFKVSYTEAVAKADDTTPTVKVTNTYVPATYELPITGGSGTEGFSVVGIGLMILAMVGLVFVNRKKLMEYL